ncbi:uncharacterized protein K444DRAFT_637477 [Hyaloscypha bicolor E]|uniref:Uncharacterized protein n=1 Tax=Hyaloscypha bicolor E TaxID=1095630 RepID=A0A2J6SNH2_9HELO|nr:uncharacterized protein K444DRAFT_637477 [Hyaloscypha bicolor E]PMD52298.1 hypothetical protein K444DRAFT_637477 [Hyaloscypha bicolor E]
MLQLETNTKAKMASSDSTSLAFRPKFRASQTPPASTQFMIAFLSSKLAGSATDSVTLSRVEVHDLVRCLQRTTESEAAAIQASNQELVAAKQDLATLRAHCRLGDYAGAVFNYLKNSTPDFPKVTRATDLGPLLRGKCSSKADARAMEVLEKSMVRLAAQDEGFPGPEGAKLACLAYSDRNLVCHSEAGALKIARDWEALAHHIDKDLRALPDILPEDQMKHLDKWEGIIEFYRDRAIVKGEDGGSFRPSSAWTTDGRRKGLRSDPEATGHRKRGPSGSLDGEPPAKVLKSDDKDNDEIVNDPSENSETSQEISALWKDLRDGFIQIIGLNPERALKELGNYLKLQVVTIDTLTGKTETKTGKELKKDRRVKKVAENLYCILPHIRLASGLVHLFVVPETSSH